MGPLLLLLLVDLLYPLYILCLPLHFFYLLFDSKGFHDSWFNGLFFLLKLLVPLLPVRFSLLNQFLSTLPSVNLLTDSIELHCCRQVEPVWVNIVEALLSFHMVNSKMALSSLMAFSRGDSHFLIVNRQALDYWSELFLFGLFHKILWQFLNNPKRFDRRRRILNLFILHTGVKLAFCATDEW
jgi:hypothetical protein